MRLILFSEVLPKTSSNDAKSLKISMLCGRSSSSQVNRAEQNLCLKLNCLGLTDDSAFRRVIAYNYM